MTGKHEFLEGDVGRCVLAINGVVCGFPASADIHTSDTAKVTQGANTTQESVSEVGALKAENERLRTALKQAISAMAYAKTVIPYGNDLPCSVRQLKAAMEVGWQALGRVK